MATQEPSPAPLKSILKRPNQPPRTIPQLRARPLRRTIRFQMPAARARRGGASTGRDVTVTSSLDTLAAAAAAAQQADQQASQPAALTRARARQAAQAPAHGIRTLAITNAGRITRIDLPPQANRTTALPTIQTAVSNPPSTTRPRARQPSRQNARAPTQKNAHAPARQRARDKARQTSRQTAGTTSPSFANSPARPPAR